MCGITGWVSYESDLTQRPGVLDAMTATMSCRGPDDSGTWLSPHAALGHRRLAIIDLPGGRQPMRVHTPGGDVVLVYSGEAYNFTELRAQLEKQGHRFTTDSDTEVVLRGYLEWGTDVAEHLNGMYAFAIWDERAQRLVLIRDRMGIKPLYYAPTRDGVLFGSEPKAILANPIAGRRVDLDGLRELFSFTKQPGWSLWKDMHEVEPGTVVTVDASGIRHHTYWKLEAAEHLDDQETTVAKVRELLTDTVHRQLVADVPRCVLLSGGLDSRAITGLAAPRVAEEGEQLRTFSVDFVGQEENFHADRFRPTPDSPYIRDVANLVGSDHQDVVLDSAQLSDPEVRRAMVRARDMPAGLGDMDTSLYLLFKAIRQESTVALSGESADELFGGYLWFHDEAAREAATFPWLAADLRPGGDSSGVLNHDLRTKLDLRGYVADQYQSALAQVPQVDGETGLERRMREVSHLHLTRMVRALLDRKDRASMAVGLEVRVPFCDHRLVEYVYNAPWALKTFDGREKSLLRHATKHVLPESVASRVKSPYPSTQDPKYAAALQKQATGLLSGDDKGLFDVVDREWLEKATRLDSEHIPSDVRHGLDQVLTLRTWLDEYSPELELS